MNQTTVIGNISKDAGFKIVNGRDVTNFTVAVNKIFKDKDGAKQSNTTWFNCALWGNMSRGISPYLLNGTKVIIQGEVNPQIYSTNDGRPVIDMKFNVGNIEILSSKQEEAILHKAKRL